MLVTPVEGLGVTSRQALTLTLLKTTKRQGRSTLFPPPNPGAGHRLAPRPLWRAALTVRGGVGVLRTITSSPAWSLTPAPHLSVSRW